MPVRSVVSHAVIEFGRRKHAEGLLMPPSPATAYPGGLDVGVGVGRRGGVLGGRISSPVPARERLSVRLCACVAFSRGKIRRQQIRNGSKG